MAPSSLLLCSIPRGFKVEYDLSQVGSTTRKRVRKWLEQGYKQAYSGEAAALYEYFRWKHKLPGAYVGTRQVWWDLNGCQLGFETVEVAMVMNKMDPITTHCNIPNYMYAYRNGDRPKAKALIEKLLEDPELVKLRATAIAEFDNTAVIVRRGGE